MYSQEALSSINARKYARTIKAAKGAPAEGVNGVVKVNYHYLVVEWANQKVPDIDHSIILITEDDDHDYYVDHEAGFQRWHKWDCTRVEALGYAKQAGVTLKQFLEAFPWEGEDGEDPIDKEESYEDSKVECEECGTKVDIDDLADILGESNVCGDCCANGRCGYCGDYAGPSDSGLWYCEAEDLELIVKVVHQIRADEGDQRDYTFLVILLADAICENLAPIEVYCVKDLVLREINYWLRDGKSDYL